MLAGRHSITSQQTFEALRTYARTRNLKVHDVSRGVVDGDIVDVLPGGR